MNLEKYLSQHKEEHTDIPLLNKQQWKEFNLNVDRDSARNSLTDYILKYRPEFPWVQVTEDFLFKNFLDFYKNDMSEMLVEKDTVKVVEHWDYQYNFENYGLGLIQMGHRYNYVSDYFHRKLRFDCDSYNRISCLKMWNDGNMKVVDKMLQPLWRMGNDELTYQTYNEAFRLGSYIATQFKPHVAKTLYEMHNAKVILDTSMGWGDRLAAFWASPSAKEYVGFDPNPETFEVYKEQCLFYHKLCGGGSYQVVNEGSNSYWEFSSDNKQVQIIREPSEDVNWWQWEDYFDMAFTSPPYFSTERYGTGGDCENDQSWKRYPTFESWKDDFFLPTTHKTWGAIKDDGYMCINIMDPKLSGRRYNLCDEMIDKLTVNKDCNFLGQFGMRIMQRAKKIESLEEKKDYYDCYLVEPIWMFRKNNSKHDNSFQGNNLNEFFLDLQ